MTNWNEVYDVLKQECGAQEHWRSNFVFSMCDDCNEYRFQGNLGFGGKLYYSDYGGLRVDCYPEDRTPEREAMIGAANERLRGLTD